MVSSQTIKQNQIDISIRYCQIGCIISEGNKLNVNEVSLGARSSTDRASDYGSEG
jgi:hypothetical protein